MRVVCYESQRFICVNQSKIYKDLHVLIRVKMKILCNEIGSNVGKCDFSVFHSYYMFIHHVAIVVIDAKVCLLK